MDFADDYIVEEEFISDSFSDFSVTELLDESEEEQYQEFTIYDSPEPQFFTEVPVFDETLQPTDVLQTASDDSPSLVLGEPIDYTEDLIEIQDFLRSIDENVSTASGDLAIVVQSVNDVAVQLRYTNYLLGALLGGLVLYAGFSKILS